jgi:hypothetical protein
VPNIRSDVVLVHPDGRMQVVATIDTPMQCTPTDGVLVCLRGRDPLVLDGPELRVSAYRLPPPSQ